MDKIRLEKGCYYSLLFFHRGRREFAILKFEGFREDQRIDGPVLTEKNGVLPSIAMIQGPILTANKCLIDHESQPPKNSSEFCCLGILSECNSTILAVWKTGFKEMNPAHAPAIDAF